jgi:ferric-dicitrate binding protein FerR (iron transport regulator)
MTHKRDIEQRTQQALEQIRRDRLSEEEAAQIADRVWQRLESHGGAAEGAEIGTIHGCEDYQALIPAFVAGSLAPSRALLLDEHTRHCVPCRRALKSARSGDLERDDSTTHRRSTTGSKLGRWAAAAALAALAVGTGYFVWNSGPALPFGAKIESAGAGLYRIDTLAPLPVGAEIAVGEAIRSAPGESSFLRLADGSLVEVKGRSELAIESARRGTTIRVDGGSVIVEAAPQGRGRLYVSTEDCLVSVKGTIFAVSHGTRGSRVAVIEGEVHVDYAGSEQVLLAGDRTATYAGRNTFALDEELAWSQGIDRYLALLREVTELRQALQRELPRPGLRYTSRLLELAPDDMVFYAAFPNLVDTLVEADRIVQERIGQSEVLREWYREHQGAGLDQHMEWASMLSEAGGFLGDEIVVTGSLDAQGEIGGPVIMAELTDPQGMRGWLEMAVVEAEIPSVVFLDVDDGDQSALGSGDDRMFVWIGDDTLIASPRAELVQQALGRRGAVAAAADGLKSQIAEVYRGGAETLVAVDAHQIAATISRGESPDDVARAERLGILDASYLIFQQKRFEDRTDHSAVLAFDGPRKGLASWLAEPAPMGSLRYVSPDAKLVASAILVDPAIIAEQLIALSRQSDGSSGLAELEAKLGLSLEDDFAAALGGELTVALDGPVVPEPAWKIVVEVYDPDKLIWAMQQVLEAINAERVAAGRQPMAWTEEQAGGRTYYGFAGELPVQFTLDEGYLVAAANRGLVERALRYRQSGYSIESSARFRKLMPGDGRENFSAFLYQDAMELLGPLAERIAQGQLTAEQQAAIESLRGQTEPTLAYAYAEEGRIVFAASGAMDLLTSGLPGMIGLRGLCLDELAPGHHEPEADETSDASQA